MLRFCTAEVTYEIEVDGEERGVDYGALDTCELTRFLLNLLVQHVLADGEDAHAFEEAWRRRMHISQRNMCTLLYNERIVVVIKRV